MPKTTKTYDLDFKKRAVQMVATSEKSASHIAKDLGIAPSTLMHWIRQFGEPQSPSSNASSHAELLEENKRLKKELHLVTQQREILKKAAAILGN